MENTGAGADSMVFHPTLGIVGDYLNTAYSLPTLDAQQDVTLLTHGIDYGVVYFDVIRPLDSGLFVVYSLLFLFCFVLFCFVVLIFIFYLYLIFKRKFLQFFFKIQVLSDTFLLCRGPPRPNSEIVKNIWFRYGFRLG